LLHEKIARCLVDCVAEYHSRIFLRTGEKSTRLTYQMSILSRLGFKGALKYQTLKKTHEHLLGVFNSVQPTSFEEIRDCVKTFQNVEHLSSSKMLAIINSHADVARYYSTKVKIKKLLPKRSIPQSSSEPYKKICKDQEH
jgi:ERCC4-type nuclease